MVESNAFAHVDAVPIDPIFLTQQLFLEDTNENKVALGIGAYRTDEGKPYVFPAVKKAEDAIISEALNKEYQSFVGHPGFLAGAQKLIFGDDFSGITDKRIASVQSLSGTGGLRVVAEFIKANFAGSKLLLPNPSWGNHAQMFEHVGLTLGSYAYFEPKTRGFDFEGCLRDLNAADDKSIVLLHACAHNPTGVDPTKEQWNQIVEVVKSKKMIAFFDSAYQGFATGDIEGDAYGVRLFANQGVPIFLTQSFAKNMGLYGERIGAVHMVTPNEETAKAVQSQLCMLLRTLCGPCPLHGARIVDRVLSDPTLKAEWIEQLKGASGRILEMRKRLREELEKIGAPGTWSHITTQIGMFSFTGLTAEQVDIMAKDYHIYFTKNGRISVAGLTTGNVAYVAQSIKGALEKAPAK